MGWPNPARPNPLPTPTCKWGGSSKNLDRVKHWTSSNYSKSWPNSFSKGLHICFEEEAATFKIAFAMTINKSQHQTLQCVGVYIPSHGQLFVAISCFTSPSGPKFLICNKGDVPHNVCNSPTLNHVYLFNYLILRIFSYLFITFNHLGGKK